MAKHVYSWKVDPNPEKLPMACVCRFGAYGDTVQAASVCASLKKAGYHVTLLCSYPASEIVALDPNIDELIILMQDQIPVNWLGHLWMWLEHKYRGKGFAKFVNLTESVEHNLLAVNSTIRFNWPPVARHNLMNVNYLEHQHALAGVPYEPSFEFYPNAEELKWCKVERERMRKAGIERLIVWALTGSNHQHKIYPHSDAIWRHVLQHYPKWGIVTTGDGSGQDLEKGFEGEPRMWKTAGKWTMRQTCTMLAEALVVVGPETGLMSAAAFMPMPKIVFLSHSTEQNLTRDWINTSSMWAPNTVCPGRGKNEVPACHKMLNSFEGCRKNEEFGTAQCVAEILPEWTWEVLQRAMNEGAGGRWTPPLVGITGE
jgi:ADP-heptose:LPS heptosyltransferase